MLNALKGALRAQLRPRMLALALLPIAGALLLWLLIYGFAWHPLVAATHSAVGWLAAQGPIGNSIANVLSESLVFVAMLVFLWPLTQATALLVTATIAMPLAVADVAAHDYPQLERRHGGSMLGSLWNALAATLIFLALWVLTLPLWFFALPAIVLPILLSAWLNARLFRYDALAEHASAEEMASLQASSGGQWFRLGLIAALLQMVPVLNLFVTVYSGLSFACMGLEQLQSLRAGGRR